MTTCISHSEYTTENVFEKTAHEICHCLGFGHVRNGSESCNDLPSFIAFNVHCEPQRFEGPLPDLPFRVRVRDNEVILHEVVNDPRDLMGYASAGRRFLNPEFWTRAMDEIESRWSN